MRELLSGLNVIVGFVVRDMSSMYGKPGHMDGIGDYIKS